MITNKTGGLQPNSNWGRANSNGGQNPSNWGRENDNRNQGDQRNHQSAPNWSSNVRRHPPHQNEGNDQFRSPRQGGNRQSHPYNQRSPRPRPEQRRGWQAAPTESTILRAMTMSESFNAAGGASNPGLKPLEEIIEPLDLRRLVNRVAEVDLKGLVLFLFAQSCGTTHNHHKFQRELCFLNSRYRVEGAAPHERPGYQMNAGERPVDTPPVPGHGVSGNPFNHLNTAVNGEASRERAASTSRLTSVSTVNSLQGSKRST